MCVTQGRMGAFATAVILMMFMVGSAESGKECQNSLECGSNACCRDASGSLLPRGQWPTGALRITPLAWLEVTGTCEMGQAKKGEYCEHCRCGPGLACYREMSPLCGIPPTCHDYVYVMQQHQRYRRSNRAPPDCIIPV